MSEFLNTTKALEDNYLQLSKLSGEHFSGEIRYGLDEAPVGYAEYQPDAHEASDIDSLAPLSDALGIDHVRELENDFALHINIVTDELP